MKNIVNLSKHKKTFGSMAKDYTKYRRPYPKKVFQTFFSLMNEKPRNILDIACGTGKSTESLVQKGTEVVGVDHDPEMIKEAKRQAKQKGLPISYVVGSVEHLDFDKETFDAVTVGTAFHWFVNKKAIQKIARVLKPNGLLFIYWTLTTKQVPEENSLPNSIYKKYKWERVPSKLRNLSYIQEFLEKNEFVRVGTLVIPFTHKDTVEDQVGLLKTASAYAILNAEEKKQFVRELRMILTEKLGKRKHFPFEEEIQICYGYKTKL